MSDDWKPFNKLRLGVIDLKNAQHYAALSEVPGDSDSQQAIEVLDDVITAAREAQRALEGGED
jgi:hypothetical protein